MHSQGNRKKALKIKDNVSTRFFGGGRGDKASRRLGADAIDTASTLAIGDHFFVFSMMPILAPPRLQPNLLRWDGRKLPTAGHLAEIESFAICLLSNLHVRQPRSG